jgi:hypothetical protein
MGWTIRADSRRFSFRKQYVYTSNTGKTLTFSRNGLLGEELQFDTHIYFTQQQWQSAIDRGLGTHATSIITQTRAVLGSYISLVEQDYKTIDLAPPAQKQKCERIRQAQGELKRLESNEREVDPSNFQNGPLQEEMFKADVQRILFILRKDLVTIDRETHSAMLGRADHIVADAIEHVHRFNWPFATNSLMSIEKNTRRQKITAQDQLQMPEGGIYQASHEFPEGLSFETVNRLLNAVCFNDPELKQDITNDVRYKIGKLGESRGVIITLLQLILTIPAFLFSPLIAFINMTLKKIDQINDNTKNKLEKMIKSAVNEIRTGSIGNLLTLFVNEPYAMLPSLFEHENQTDKFETLDLSSETRLQKAVSDAHAKRIATAMAPQRGDLYPQVKNAIHELKPKITQKKFSINEALLEKKILWELCLQRKIEITTLTKEEKQLLTEKLTPFYNLDFLTSEDGGLKTTSLHPIAPENKQGSLFTRVGLTGTLHTSIDPIFRTLETLNRNDPILGSATTLLWGLGGLYLGSTAAVEIAPILAGTVWMKVLSALESVPGISTSLAGFLSGPLPISPLTTIQEVVAQITQGIYPSAPLNHEFQLNSKLRLRSQTNVLSELKLITPLLEHQTLLNKADTNMLKRLLPSTTPQTESIDIPRFLSERYPECVLCYGGRKDEGEEGYQAWNDGLNKALSACYLNDLLLMRRTNPNAWVLLIQYPSIVASLSTYPANVIASIPISPQHASPWVSTILITPFRAIHGLLGGLLIGLPLRLYYSATYQVFPPNFQRLSGYTNLLGLLEGLPYLMHDFFRMATSMNNMFMQAKARLYDSARTFPQNVKSIPGFVGSFALAIPLILFDALISIPSLLWNSFASFARFLAGKPQRSVHYLYKLPIIGVLIEFLKERTFEERATRRIIQSNQDSHEFIGKARSVATARAGDLSSYRKSHVETTFLTAAPFDTERTINISELQKALADYTQHKTVFSADSYIMAKIAQMIQLTPSAATLKESALLKHLFPEEARQFENQFKLEHIRQYEEEKENLTTLNNQCNQFCYALLKSLLQQELFASNHSKTYEALIGHEASSKKNHSTVKLFKHLEIKEPVKTNDQPKPPNYNNPLSRSSVASTPIKDVKSSPKK